MYQYNDITFIVPKLTACKIHDIVFKFDNLLCTVV